VGPAVEGVGVHTLLHSVAVGWLESGVHIKAVADLIGHSSIGVTGDIYGHTTDNAARHCRRMERCARSTAW
jgi:site-specific recombinase XerD